MSYTNRFDSTDTLILHLIPYVNSLTDTSIKANYTGFLSVSAVTVYELAIKDIFRSFAEKKHIVFGDFVQKHFSSINGRIKLQDLKSNHISPFGEKYLKKFETRLSFKEKNILIHQKKDLRSSYTNLILCRHKFVHVGYPTLTFQEVIDSYLIGKDVIHSLNEAMQR